MLRYTSTVAIVGMGLLLVIVVGEIDLSFGFLYGLCANTMAVSLAHVGLASLAGAYGGLWRGGLLGPVQRLLHDRRQGSSFIATLGSGTLIFGFTLLITNTKTFNYLYPGPGHQGRAG